jgi:hypothetical protein
MRPVPAVLERIDALLHAPQAINDRENYYYDVVAGIREYVMGDLEKGCENLARAARFSDYFRVVRDDFGGGASFARTFPTTAELHAEHPHLAPADPQEHTPQRKPWRLALTSHADSLYAEAFFPGWIEQLGALGVPGLGLHLHVVFRQMRQPELLDRLAGQAAEYGLDLLLTTEAGRTRDKAYFACSRFLQARALLERFRCGTVFVDADAFIVDPERFRAAHVERLVEETRVTGMIAPSFSEGYLPWRRFSAGWLVLPYNDAGRGFADLVGRCVRYFWDERVGRNWWIDQFALEAARHIMLRTPSNAGSFGSWPATYPESIAAVGERNKMARVAETSAMRDLMAQGLSYHQAMVRINRGG